MKLELGAERLSLVFERIDFYLGVGVIAWAEGQPITTEAK